MGNSQLTIEFNKKQLDSNYNMVNLEKIKVNHHYKSRKSLEPLSQLKFTSSKEIIINANNPKKNIRNAVNRSVSIPVLNQHASVRSLSDLSSLWENNDRKSVVSIHSENNYHSEFEESQLNQFKLNDLKEVRDSEKDVMLTIDEEDLIKHFVLIENWMEFDHVKLYYIKF